MSSVLVKTFNIPSEYLKKTTFSGAVFYNTINVYNDKVVGKGRDTLTWKFDDFKSINVVTANMNSQFGQIVFAESDQVNNGNLAHPAEEQLNPESLNRILICAGMFAFKKTNKLTEEIGIAVKNAFEKFHSGEVVIVDEDTATESDNSKVDKSEDIAETLRMFKQLLDDGVISQEEFDSKKSQLLNL